MSQTAAERGIARGPWSCAQLTILEAHVVTLEARPDGGINFLTTLEGKPFGCQMMPTGDVGRDERLMRSALRVVEKGVVEYVQGAVEVGSRVRVMLEEGEPLDASVTSIAKNEIFGDAPGRPSMDVVCVVDASGETHKALRYQLIPQ